MNLLTDPLIRTRTDLQTVKYSLPALMEAYGQDDVISLLGLQRYQEDAFHVFMCYLAGAVLARSGTSNPIQSESFWTEGLRNLAGSAGESAWALVVDDLSKPAFLQPPLPEEDQKRLRPLANTPDSLDLLPTAKNHDLKQARAHQAETDEWIFALMSLQTMSGFFGRDNPGISRMNGGFGSRMIVELTRSTRPGIRWADAVKRLLKHRNDALDGGYGYDPDGLVLVWCEIWDGKASLPLEKLDPFYVEICRRIRLRGKDRVTHAEIVPSPANRIAAKELKGVVGDPWLPIDLGSDDRQTAKDIKALTVSPQGLTPELLRELVFPDRLRLSKLQEPLDDWVDDINLVVSVLVRGQGTTDGFHERSIMIPKKERSRVFGSVERKAPLATLSRIGIDHAGVMVGRVLRPAVFHFIEGGPERLKGRDSSQAWWGRFARRFQSLWSDNYWPWLWGVSEPIDEEVATKEWDFILQRHALTVLQEAQESLPHRTGRRYRAITESERVFWGSLFRHFPLLKEDRDERAAGG